MAGDTSAVQRLDDDTLGAVMVDVTGHGAEPALQAIRTRDLLLHSLILGSTPAEAMNSVAWSAPSDVLAPALAVRTSLTDGHTVICSAGHPPAILVGTQTGELVEPTGPLLYLDPSSEYWNEELVMDPGSELVLFSDGVADVQRLDNGKSEPERLADLLLAEGGDTARSAELVLGFADPEPSDDQTVVVIRRLI